MNAPSDAMPEVVRAATVTLDDLPSLGLDLPDGEPREVHKVVGLLVVATALFRSSWPEEIDMSLARSQAMRRDEPKPGETLATGEAVLVDTVNARRCLLCTGGWVQTDNRFHGDGTRDGYRCNDCDGTGELVTAKVEMVSDQRAVLHDVLLPAALRMAPGMISLERIVESLVPPIPDEAFRCHDLRKVAEVSAYRGAQRQQDPTFFGWSFRDTIDLGSKAVSEFLRGKGRLLASDIRAYAWPLLWLRYERAHLPMADVVIVRDALGAARRIRSDEGEKPVSMPA
jgi:hypothetical protein